MGKFKIIAVLFAITCVLSLNNIKADSSLGFNNITIPSAQGVYESSSVKKVTTSTQYVKGFGAYDTMSGDGRALLARISGTSTYYDVIDDQYVNIDPLRLSNNPGTYKLQVKAKRWTVSTAKANLYWILDDYLIN